MREGITVAGNLIVDITYPIERWPEESELTTITSAPRLSIGGAVGNTISDLARLDPALPLRALGIIGQDGEGLFILDQMKRYPNIDLSGLCTNGRTSFTAVMSDNETKKRTFFQYRGSNADFDESFIDFSSLNSRIFHIGYILLLDALDQEDAEYGTKMARLLHDARESGLKTSIDLVSESGDRYRRLVLPALKYTDYCVINELEAERSTLVPLRDDAGRLLTGNMPKALTAMRDAGVSVWAVIHCPEGSYGMDESGRYVALPSLRLPKGYIKGTVGAGDAFCAGVLLGAHNGYSLEKAMECGVCSAAASLSMPGGSEGVGTLEDVLKLKKRYAVGLSD